MKLGHHVNFVQVKVKLFYLRIAKGIQKSFSLINRMTRTLCLSYKILVLKSQMELCQEFVKTRDMEFPHVCDLIRIMLAIPSNSVWVECTYSKLEQLYQKGYNQIDVNHFNGQFFFGSLNFPFKECMDCVKEMSILQRPSFFYETFHKYFYTFCCSNSEFVFILRQYELF